MQDAPLPQAELSARYRRGVATRLDRIEAAVEDMRQDLEMLVALLDERKQARSAPRQQQSRDDFR